MIQTEFQQGFDPNKTYSGSELRQVVLELFPEGEQVRRFNSSVEEQVRFRGLSFIRNTKPTLLVGYDLLYERTQLGDGSREEVLEKLIPDSWERVGEWVEIIEMKRNPIRPTQLMNTRFDYCNGDYMFKRINF